MNDHDYKMNLIIKESIEKHGNKFWKENKNLIDEIQDILSKDGYEIDLVWIGE